MQTINCEPALSWPQIYGKILWANCGNFTLSSEPVDQELRAASTDPPMFDWSDVMRCTVCGVWCVVQGADIVLTDVDGKTAFHWTANNPDDSTIKTLLVRKGARERGGGGKLL